MKFQYLILFITIIFFFCSCSDDNVETEYYKINVDSLAVEDTLNVSDTLKIHLYGTIGTNGCYSFHRYEPYISNNTLDLTVWGKHEKHEICTTVMVNLDDFFNVSPVLQGNFYININQPSGAVLRDTVYVR